MTSPAILRRILTAADRNTPVADIAATVELTPGRVYAILRRERPRRKRKERRRTSDKPAMIRGMAGEGIKPARIALVLGVSRAYVYRILSE